jgi:20S proteasome alpha/beta subunit
MTTCVAVICDDGNAIVLVADKMIGIGYVESELEITKMRQIHRNWWILFAGEDITPVFDIVDYAKAGIGNGAATIADVQDAVRKAFAQKRLEDAEALYLTPIGWEIETFNKDGHALLPNFEEIQTKIDGYALSIQLLVAGFDAGKAHIFSLYGYGEKRGITQRTDIPGFDSIGSGATAATFMMYYRDVSPKAPVREAVYYALEGKYLGEQASGVSGSTDLFVARPDKELIQLNDEETIEEKLIPVCYDMSPNLLRTRDYAVLNSLPELDGFPEVKKPEKKTKPKPKKAQSQPPEPTPLMSSPGQQ